VSTEDERGGQRAAWRKALAAAAVIIEPGRDTRSRLCWSDWRRRHQHTAQACHYQRQAADDP
jgi:hypothetical protein